MDNYYKRQEQIRRLQRQMLTKQDRNNYFKATEGTDRMGGGFSQYALGRSYGETVQEAAECGVRILRAAIENLTNFRTANPITKMRTNSRSSFEYEVLTKGGAYGQESKYSGIMIDHGRLWKCGRSTKDVFLVGQPYNLCWLSPDYSTDELDDELIVKVLPTKYSWYLPNSTYLVFVGRPDIIESLDLDYNDIKAKQVELTMSHLDVDW